MSEKWYDNLPEDYFKSQEDKDYERAFSTIREGIALGLGFDAACARIDVQNELLRGQIISDMLKVFLAEEHFAKNIPLENLAVHLQVSRERLEAAKAQMLNEVAEGPPASSRIKSYPSDPGIIEE